MFHYDSVHCLSWPGAGTSPMVHAVDMLAQTHPIPPLKMEEEFSSETQSKFPGPSTGLHGSRSGYVVTNTHPIPPLRMEEESTSYMQANFSIYTLFKTEQKHQRQMSLKT
jgi:hypothetical protein